MRARRHVILAFAFAFTALLLSGCARSSTRNVTAVPSDGSTEVAFANHLPTGYRITNIRLELDGDPITIGDTDRIISGNGGSPSSNLASARDLRSVNTQETSSLFRARIPEGAHTLKLVCDVQVPCGLASEPQEKLTATIARSFEVGPSGGLVHVDAFATSPLLNPAERVHILVSLRGLREGRRLFGQTKEAKEACGRLGHLERSRCIVQRLADRARAQNDVAGLLCQKDKLETIDDLVAGLDARSSEGHERETRSRSALSPDERRLEVEARVDQLEREAEYCVAEDLSWMGEQQVTSDRSACAQYDELLPY